MEKLLVIVGPTAVGKSDVALCVSQKQNGEIISADSVQVYRGLDIGAAKPSARERKLVPHHLIDFVNPNENYTVAGFQRDAKEAISGVHARGRLPVLVGGTGLYVRAVLQGFAFSESGIDEELRNRLRSEAELYGPEFLHSKLADVDPAAAEKLHPNDLRRVIRALEVYEQTHQPISRQVEATPQTPVYDAVLFGLTMPRDMLYARIEQRVDSMMAAGLVEEVDKLLHSGVSPQAKSMQSLGYKQIVKYLKGEVSREAAVELIKRDTRRFAKRQLTWFRREHDIQWFDILETGGIEAVAENISIFLAGNCQ
ncbi:MAG: tRNA (adenosine(37)-N6)-dimethylallyltransferase MiaA [Bacillota bacterium]|nr:tRNA (adenosine(37)-N6)-dimethylallyltransferase MiaA [Bacillota bacterium]MDW7685077.1 tRNA (adenosine(37)-N6)-dimethylallyltransferase MiaA [Bacillota bacterium]